MDVLPRLFMAPSRPMMPRRCGKCFTAAFLLPYGRLMISAKCGTGSGDRVVLAFGHYQLDIERRELRRGTELIELEPRAFDLLAFLSGSAIAWSARTIYCRRYGTGGSCQNLR